MVLAPGAHASSFVKIDRSVASAEASLPLWRREAAKEYGQIRSESTEVQLTFWWLLLDSMEGKGKEAPSIRVTTPSVVLSRRNYDP
jgi:hypothetical protein